LVGDDRGDRRSLRALCERVAGLQQVPGLQRLEGMKAQNFFCISSRHWRLTEAGQTTSMNSTR